MHYSLAEKFAAKLVDKFDSQKDVTKVYQKAINAVNVFLKLEVQKNERLLTILIKSLKYGRDGEI